MIRWAEKQSLKLSYRVRLWRWRTKLRMKPWVGQAGRCHRLESGVWVVEARREDLGGTNRKTCG